MPVYDIVTVGSALLDIFMRSDKFISLPCTQYADGFAMAIERGGKTEVSEVEVCSGGAGSNNAVSFARKGFKTGIVAELGTDLVATTIKAELKREHVDIGMLVEEQDETTGISSVLVAPDGGRSIAVFRGASGMLTESDISWYRLDTDWLFISSLGGEMTLLTELLNYAHDNDIKVAINPGKKELEQAKTNGGVNLYQHAEILILNREEAALLTDEPYEDDTFWHSDKSIPGPHIVLITDGKSGGKVTVDGKTEFYSPKTVKTVEETGAGDAFGSGFTAALMKGYDIQTALEWAKNQAASVVSYMGAKKGLLTLDQIQQKS